MYQQNDSIEKDEKYKTLENMEIFIMNPKNSAFADVILRNNNPKTTVFIKFNIR